MFENIFVIIEFTFIKSINTYSIASSNNNENILADVNDKISFINTSPLKLLLSNTYNLFVIYAKITVIIQAITLLINAGIPNTFSNIVNDAIFTIVDSSPSLTDSYQPSTS